MGLFRIFQFFNFNKDSTNQNCHPNNVERRSEANGHNAGNTATGSCLLSAENLGPGLARAQDANEEEGERDQEHGHRVDDEEELDLKSLGFSDTKEFMFSTFFV